MKKIFLFAVSLMLVFCCGCNGYREIERGYLVTSVGIKKENGRYIVVLETLASDGNSQNVKILSADGDTVGKIFDELKNKNVKKLYFEHCGIIALESDFFDSETVEILNFLKNSNLFNLDVYVIFTDDVYGLLDSGNSIQGVGYDVISLIKNADKNRLCSQLYVLERKMTYKESFNLPKVNFKNNVLVLE